MRKTTVAFDDALAGLASSSAPGSRILRGLTDLVGEQLADLQAAWPMLSDTRRAYLTEKLREMAEDDIKLDFTPIFRFTISDVDERVRLASVEGLAEDETASLIDPLAVLLRSDPSEVVRAACATKLGDFMLLGELEKINRYRRDQVYSALMGAILANEPATLVYHRALESLAYVANEQIEQLIRDAFASDSPDLRVAAVCSMGRSNDRQYSEVVLKQVQAVYPAMRGAAARACGELEVAAGVPVLGKLIGDSDNDVSLAAIISLAEIGGDDARRILEGVTKSSDEELAVAAGEALEEFDFLHGDIKFDTSWFDEVGAGEHDHEQDA